MNEKPWLSSAVLGITLGVAIAAAGFFIGGAMYKLRGAERYVSVKGLDEREVPANLAIWPLTIQVVGNDLSALQSTLDSQKGVVSGFLVGEGFGAGEMAESQPQITDYEAERSYGNEVRPPYRYMAKLTLMLRTANVGLVKTAMGKTGQLVQKGIVLAPENWENSTEFLFTDLNSIKPAMIAEATKNARKAAEQFASDSGSKVGAIRRARQGLFTIADRDKSSPDIKIVRVVTDVDYFVDD